MRCFGVYDSIFTALSPPSLHSYLKTEAPLPCRVLNLPHTFYFSGVLGLLCAGVDYSEVSGPKGPAAGA